MSLTYGWLLAFALLTVKKEMTKTPMAMLRRTPISVAWYLAVDGEKAGRDARDCEVVRSGVNVEKEVRLQMFLPPI